MQHLKILNSKETKRILKLLKQQFGFEGKLGFVFLVNNKDRVYVVNRDIERVELEKLRINALGLYFGTFIKGELRLSIEGSQIIGPRAKKNILDINDKEFEIWLKGEDFKMNTDLEGFVLVKYRDDFVGCGKVSNGTLLNYVPKARRLIVVNN
ncbi:MAG: hypothetical protein ISS25_03075 [Nanoarchaeota archaeon]|nr:hypothetical protein [DPANN group archaeon]MBL7116783.1 hypothetical protein [Nanoarchaeota archaeon]